MPNIRMQFLDMLRFKGKEGKEGIKRWRVPIGSHLWIGLGWLRSVHRRMHTLVFVGNFPKHGLVVGNNAAMID